MVPAEQKEVLGVLHLVRQEKADHLQTLLAAVDVVAEEQVVRLGREAAVLEEAEQIAVLAVHIAANLRGASSSSRQGCDKKISLRRATRRGEARARRVGAGQRASRHRRRRGGGGERRRGSGSGRGGRKKAQPGRPAAACLLLCRSFEKNGGGRVARAPIWAEGCAPGRREARRDARWTFARAAERAASAPGPPRRPSGPPRSVARVSNVVAKGGVGVPTRRVQHEAVRRPERERRRSMPDPKKTPARRGRCARRDTRLKFGSNARRCPPRSVAGRHRTLDCGPALRANRREEKKTRAEKRRVRRSGGPSAHRAVAHSALISPSAS